MHQKAFNSKYHANWLLILQKGLIQLNITYPKEEATKEVGYGDSRASKIVSIMRQEKAEGTSCLL